MAQEILGGSRPRIPQGRAGQGRAGRGRAGQGRAVCPCAHLLHLPGDLMSI